MGVRARSTASGGPASTGGASAEGLTMEAARQALKSLFGHEDFRDGQVGGVHLARRWCWVISAGALSADQNHVGCGSRANVGG